jgi:hypothetical protein
MVFALKWLNSFYGTALLTAIGVPPFLFPLASWMLGKVIQSFDDYLEYCMKNNKKFTLGGYLKWLLDPSGTVYDAESGEPLEDVTVTLYYLDPETGQSIKWDAEDYDQLNPLTTDIEGNYLWDVPEGKWKVVCHKEGYEDAESEWLDVPPIRTDVNITMTANGETISTTTATATTTVTTTSTQTSTTTTSTTSTTTTTTTTTKDKTTTSSTTTTTTTSNDKTTTTTVTDINETTSTTTSPVTQPDYTLGDVNNDGKINAVDASDVLAYYARISTNQEGGYTEEQKLAADVTHDGSINAVDASNILAYYAYVSTTKETPMSMEEYMKKK